MGKTQPPDEANNTPAVPDVQRPTASDTKTETRVSHQDVETTSCKAGDDVDWEKGVPGRKTGTMADASQLIDFGDEKGDNNGAAKVGDGGSDKSDSQKGLGDLSDADLNQSFRDLKEKSYTSEGRNDPDLQKQLDAVAGEKVGRLKAALAKGDDAFAKAIGDIDFNDKDNANLTCAAFGDLCRQGGFGGELKYFTEKDGSTEIRMFMKKSNDFETVNLKSSKPTAEEAAQLAKAVHKSLDQRGQLPTAADIPPQSKGVDAAPKRLEAAAEKTENKGTDPEIAKHLEEYRAVLQLMDNFMNFDTKPGDKTITLDELKNFKSNKPEEQKAAKFALENFAKLSGGGSGITRDSLKQPLIESLTNSVKASKGSDIPPAVKEALASWVTMPRNDEEAKYLEDKINKNLEGSGKSVTISQKEYPDYADKKVPVTTISVKSDKGVEQFLYAKTEDAKESLLPGTPIKGGFTLLETKDPAKSLGAQGPFAESLAKFHTLKNLKQMADFSDRNRDGLFSKSELDAVKPYDGKDEKAKDYAEEHFPELAKTAPTGDKRNINLADKSVAEKSPELKKDLEFLAKVFRNDPSVSIEQIKDFAKAAEANKQSPLSKGFSEYNKNTNQNEEARLEKQTKARDAVQKTIDSFDELAKKYGGSPDEGSLAGLRKQIENKSIADPKLAEAAKEISYSGGETFSKEGIEKEIKKMKEKPNLYDFEKERLAKFQYGLDNFDKLKDMSNPKEPSIQLSKVPADGNAFLGDKNNQYGLDKDHDGRVTKAELEDYVKGLDKEIKTGTEKQAEEQKLYQEAMERFKSIINNADALVKATKGDAAGMSTEDIDNAMLDSLAESIKVSAKENGVKLPKALETAIHDGISNREGKDFEAAKERLNTALKNSGYQVDLSMQRENGPHGPSVRKVTFKLIDQKNPSQPGTFTYSYDTVR